MITQPKFRPFLVIVIFVFCFWHYFTVHAIELAQSNEFLGSTHHFH